MKKLVAIVGALILGTNASMDVLGWYSDYVLLNVDSAGSAYYWIGTDPSYGTQFDSNDFGQVTSLMLTGADMRYSSDTQDRSGGSFFVSIDGSAATEYIWTQSGPEGNAYQGLWSGSVDLLSGLSSGNHTLSVWAKNWGSGQGDSWLSNNSLNYNATFTTAIPEPATATLFGLVGLGFLAFRRMRK